MADTLERNDCAERSPISESASPIIATDQGGLEDYLCDAAMRLDRLDMQVDAIKLSLLRMYVYVTVRQAETRQRAIDACLAAGLQIVPVDRMESEVHRVLVEILAEVQ